MAKIEAIESRLLNWARWKLASGNGSMGYARAGAGDGGGGGYREASIPITDCEAADTEEAITLLPLHLRETIGVHYLGEYQDAQRQAARLQCSVPTLYARLTDAHRRLQLHFVERHAAAKAERERVQRLTGEARQQDPLTGALSKEFHAL